jgi:hypothetical protein
MFERIGGHSLVQTVSSRKELDLNTHFHIIPTEVGHDWQDEESGEDIPSSPLSQGCDLYLVLLSSIVLSRQTA